MTLIKNQEAGEDSHERPGFQPSMDPASDEPPPILGTWRKFYAVTLIYALTWILGLALLTQIWRR